MLQIHTDFIYMKDKFGKTYGWGVAQYTTLEVLFGYDFIASAYQTDPMESKKMIIGYLKELLPNATEQQIIKSMRI